MDGTEFSEISSSSAEELSPQQQIQDYAFFLADEYNDTNMRRHHGNAFVEKCYGKPNANCEWTVSCTGKMFIPRRYQDYVHVLGRWSHGGNKST
jgi:hypothetical protein